MHPQRLRTIGVFLILVGWCLQANSLAQSFQTIVLDPEVGKVCYAVTAADVDGDGKLDPVAISERQAMWYRNPDWKKHVMISDMVPKDHVCIAAQDIDADGQIDFSLGAGWPKNGGTIHWIRRGASLDAPWQVHDIAAEAWTHRMRWADVLGTGRSQLVVSPLNKTAGDGVRLLVFPIPEDPITGPWTPIVMDGSRNRVHNHWHIPSADGRRHDTVLASQEGLGYLARTADGFQLSPITSGVSGAEATEQGTGEIKSGRLGQGQNFFATIEPMHGNQVVVYLMGETFRAEQPQRIVLDDSFVQGHAIWCADLNGDGRDEIIAAHREPGTGPVSGPAIFIYQAQDAAGSVWQRRVLDPNMACEDVWCEDFNEDGRIDILAGGRKTHDVKLYLNQGP